MKVEHFEQNKEILHKLEGLPLLESLSAEDLRGILSLSNMIKYEPGEWIIREGQFDNRIYFLITGQVGIRKKGETLSVLKRKGDIFGEMGIIDGSPRSDSIMAIEETVCLAVDVSYLDRLKSDQKAAFGYVLYRVFAEILADRLRTADEDLLKAKDENAMLKADLEKLRATQKHRP